MKKKKVTTKRKRKQSLSKEPNSLAVWRVTISREEEMNQFLLRGSTKQKKRIMRVLKYLKQCEPLEFRTIKGIDWLKKFKESINED